MEKEIKKVEDYFKNKLLSGDFEVSETKEHTVKLIIDSKYVFTIWTGNFDIPSTRRCYDGGENYMNIPFNKTESIKLHGKLSPIVNKFRKEVLLAKKKEELKRLQKELSKIE